MQVEDERRHADQYKEQVLSHNKTSVMYRKIHSRVLLLDSSSANYPQPVTLCHLLLRWRKPTLV